MNLATLSLFHPACFALNMAPGPNNLLSVSNSTRYGYRTACLAWQLWCADPGVENVVASAPVGMLALARQEFLVAAGKPYDCQYQSI